MIKHVQIPNMPSCKNLINNEEIEGELMKYC